MIRVVFFQRKPRPHSNWSVEFIFDEVRRHLSPDIASEVAVCRFPSNGLFRRLYDTVLALFRQGDVNHVTGDVTFLSYLLARRRTVVTILDCGIISGEMTLRKRVLRLLWFRLPVRRAEVVTVISNAVKADLLRHVVVAPEKIEVVPVFVSAGFRPVARPFATARPVVLQVGTKPNKNLPRLIEALSGIPCRLHVVGELTADHRRRLAESGVEFSNFVSVSPDEMVRLYEECDLVAFVSTFEGFGMPILEANRVGRPVVAGDVASMPEVAGGSACLVNPFDVASIRAGIRRVLEDPGFRDDLVRRGHRNVERYDVRVIARLYEGIYRRLAGK